MCAGDGGPEGRADVITIQIASFVSDLLGVSGRAILEGLIDAVRTLDARLHVLLTPFEAVVERLSTIPGVSTLVAQTVIADIGADVHRFPTPGHLRSWVGLCPRLDESAGKRRSTRLRHGAPWLKTVLIQSAWAAIRRKDAYAHAQFQRLKAKRGPKKAIVAVAAARLTRRLEALGFTVVLPPAV